MKNQQKKEFFNRLHNEAEQKVSRQKDRETEYLHGIKSKDPVPANTYKKNQIIVENRKKKRFETIFEYLDDDKDGMITSKNINLEVMNLELLEIMSPMFFEIEDYDLTLSMVEFVKACNNFYNSLDYVKKKRFLM